MRKLVLHTALVAIFSIAAPAAAETGVKSPSGYFRFHIDPWISLHHFAYHYARAEEKSRKLRGRVALVDEDRRVVSGVFRTACSALIPAYRPYIESSLLFDEETRQLGRQLTDGPKALGDAAVRDALVTCMPAYEMLLWSRHRAASEKLLNHLSMQLTMYETKMATRLADALEGTWPEAPIRVDLTPYANWAGAYTDDSPAHITLSSLDEGVSGIHAFEILFHEAGHTASFGQSLLSATNSALERTDLEDDRFWHYVLFFVAGRATKDVMSDPDYVPFSVAAGLTERETAIDYYRALNETWDGASSFHERVLRAAERVSEGQQ